jgi:hypothetical protein
MDAQQLRLDEQELTLNAKKDGLKMAADRRTANAKIDIELERMVRTPQNNQTPKKES